jgi:hypothetical protein
MLGLGCHLLMPEYSYRSHPDLRPAAFTLTAKTAIERSTVTACADDVVVTGIAGDTPCYTEGGEYRTKPDGGAYGAWGSTMALVALNATVQVRQTSSASYSTATVMRLVIGGESANFSVTTRDKDETPNAWSITAYTDADVDTDYTRDVVVAGVDDDCPWSCSGAGVAKIGAGSYAASGTINAGQTLTVKLRSSALAATLVSTTVTIGTSSNAFNVTTAA